MKIFTLLFSIIFFTGAATANTLTLNAKNNLALSNQQQLMTVDPFDNDPFFQSNDDLFKEMNKIQHEMRKLMQSHFSRMQNSLTNQYPGQSNSNNIQIQESNDKLVYKIKLPEGADKKIDVSIKDGHLVISSNVTQKISREQDNSKSYSYSQSSNTQSFQLPPGYDENSMTTQMKGKNLIVTLKKLLS